MGDQRDYTPSCAVCGGPGEPECPCEGERLELAVNTAEKKWIESWITKSRDWVTSNAVHYITNIFAQLKRARIANYAAYITQLPNYDFYARHHGRPPLHPQVLYQLQRQIHEAKADLRREVDQDWKMCVLRYPEVLAHYYSLIHMQLPREFDPPVLNGLAAILPPPVPAAPPPTPQANSVAAAAVAAAGGVPPVFGMGGGGGGGAAAPGMPPPSQRPMSRPEPSHAASQSRRSSVASKKMSKEDRETENELFKMLYAMNEKKNPRTPGPASAAGTSQHTKRRDSLRSSTVPPGVPMPPPFPGIRGRP